MLHKIGIEDLLLSSKKAVFLLSNLPSFAFSFVAKQVLPIYYNRQQDLLCAVMFDFSCKLYGRIFRSVHSSKPVAVNILPVVNYLWLRPLRDQAC